MKNDETIFVANEQETLRRNLELRRSALPERISADSEAVENSLPRLVLSIIELIRQLLERQALRRMDAGNLTEEEIEQLGLALMKLEEKMEDLKGSFGLSEEDLKLSLGSVSSFE
jgi:CII-binding regulator of phage lambda lysogenization HflD